MTCDLSTFYRMLLRFIPKLVLPIFLILFSTAFETKLSAQADPVEIVRVRFDTNVGRDNWKVVNIELRTNVNPLEDARDRNFIDNITLDLFLSYQLRDDSFDFYRSQVRIVSLRRGDRRNVVFAIPGQVVERDRLRNEPFAYLIQLDIDGNRVPVRDAHVSTSIRGNADAIERMVSEAASQGNRNDGVLLPQYFLPEGLIRIDPNTAPPFFRLEN